MQDLNILSFACALSGWKIFLPQSIPSLRPQPALPIAHPFLPGAVRPRAPRALQDGARARPLPHRRLGLVGGDGHAGALRPGRAPRPGAPVVAVRLLRVLPGGPVGPARSPLGGALHPGGLEPYLLLSTSSIRQEQSASADCNRCEAPAGPGPSQPNVTQFLRLACLSRKHPAIFLGHFPSSSCDVSVLTIFVYLSPRLSLHVLGADVALEGGPEYRSGLLLRDKSVGSCSSAASRDCLNRFQRCKL